MKIIKILLFMSGMTIVSVALLYNYFNGNFPIVDFIFKYIELFIIAGLCFSGSILVDDFFKEK